MMNKLLWLSVTLGVICLILLIYIFVQRKELKFHRLQQDELDQYAVEVESVYRQMRGIRHDYRNHLQAMGAFVEASEYDELHNYIQQLTNEMNQVDMIIQTGNTMVDALVNTKLTRAQAGNVQLYATAIAPAKLPIENVDLAIILGNLLNNAVEATVRDEKSSQSAEQFIRLYIAPMKDNLYINVTNTMKKNPQPSFLSLKAPSRQGYGIRRINQAVEKYNGITNRQWEDGVFSTEITIPLS